MKEVANTLWVPAFRRFAQLVAVVVMVQGCLVLAGWVSGIATLRTVLPGTKPTNPVSAIALILAGLALLLRGGDLSRWNRRIIVRLLSLVIVSVGLMRLGDCLALWSNELDGLLFSTKLGVARMAPNTAVAFTFVGLALLVLDVGAKRGACPSQWMAFPPLAIALLALLGYLYHVQSFYWVASFAPMSFTSALASCLLSLGILAVHAERGVMTLFVSDNIGGVMARRLVPASLLVLSVAGWLRLKGERMGLYDTEYGLSLFTVTNLLFLTVLILWIGRQLGGIDNARRAAADELRLARDELERRVRDRTRDLTRVVEDVRREITILAGSTRAIVTVTNGLAAGAADITAALVATVSTVEEMRRMARVTSENAGQVAESSRKAEGMSACGKMATKGTLEGMRRIGGEMASIDGCMERLREQARTIGQIITAVDDLAAQSNLLAVNAAIEAAKAGEQGKGFSVVAREVKHLAQQSKQATRQVRAILGEIQKAAQAALSATEHGRLVVDEGGAQSVSAMESIQALAGSLSEAVQASEQIAASIRQQMTGTDHVAQAMARMREISVTYVEGTGKLKSAAHELDVLGQRLEMIADGRKA